MRSRETRSAAWRPAWTPTCPSRSIAKHSRPCSRKPACGKSFRFHEQPDRPAIDGRLAMILPEVVYKGRMGTFDVINPATSAVLDRAPDASVEDAARAIEKSVAAFASWKSKTAF